MHADLYIDAVARAEEERTWGALAAVGQAGADQVASVVSDLKSRNHTLLETTTGELKGKVLPDAEIRYACDRLQGSSVFFWGQRYPDSAAPVMEEVRNLLVLALRSQRANRDREGWEEIERLSREQADYLSRDLKEVNLNKFVSILVHGEGIVKMLAARGIVSNLTSVNIVVDRENFPSPAVCAWGLKWWYGAKLQAYGMSLKLTGDVPFEKANEGAIRLSVEGDSKLSAGLELVDILSHGSRRELPSFSLVKR